MKKTTLINREISYVIASMGHLDMLVVSDSGLPTPLGVKCVDLALCKGIPSFSSTVKAISSELEVQTIIIANELQSHSPQILALLIDCFPNANVIKVSHEEFKTKTHEAKAIVRTGEFTPYANVILVSGVVF